MFKHVLTPVDGSKLSIDAAHQAINLAKFCDARLTVLLVSPTYRQLADEGFVSPMVNEMRGRWKAEMAGRAKRVLDKMEAEARGAGVNCKTVHEFDDTPYRAIIGAAKKHRCDVVVMGSHGHGGVKQFILGSETSRVLSHSNIPVLVYR